MRYEYFKHSIAIEGKVSDSYGIIFFSNGTEVIRIHDISTDFEIIQKLVSLLNDKRPNPFKLGEVLEDFINQEDFI